MTEQQIKRLFLWFWPIFSINIWVKKNTIPLEKKSLAIVVILVNETHFGPLSLQINLLTNILIKTAPYLQMFPHVNTENEPKWCNKFTCDAVSH